MCARWEYRRVLEKITFIQPFIFRRFSKLARDWQSKDVVWMNKARVKLGINRVIITRIITRYYTRVIRHAGLCCQNLVSFFFFFFFFRAVRRSACEERYLKGQECHRARILSTPIFILGHFIVGNRPRSFLWIKIRFRAIFVLRKTKITLPNDGAADQDVYFFCLWDWNLAPLLHLRHLKQDSDLVRVLRKEGDPS